MKAIEVCGRRPLNGRVRIQGSKNAVLPMMAAALLSKGTTVLHRVPKILDVFTMMEILESLGCVCGFSDGTVVIDGKNVSSVTIPELYVGKMRSSLMVLGPLLSRQGEAVTSFPGGCVLGKRPIDLHLMALRALGAEITEAGGMIIGKAKRLSGAEISFGLPSVGATENAVMAAVLARGTTVLKGCAKEPEIAELCEFLKAMGAKISGIGESTLVIEGVEKLHSCQWNLGADRICAGTYLAAGLMTAGDVAVCGVKPRELASPLSVLKQMGAEIFSDERNGEIRLVMKKRPRAVRLSTGPYPQFPTDLQSIFLAAALTAEGESAFTETVFEARFEAAKTLRHFGAGIRLEGRTAVAEGRERLSPAIVRAPDLRGGAALVLAGLAAEGVSLIDGGGHIERGYEDICRDLKCLGAEICEI